MGGACPACGRSGACDGPHSSGAIFMGPILTAPTTTMMAPLTFLALTAELALP